MPVTRYVGRTTWFRGKRLYDILSRLKDFGKGRIVYRHVFNERYPEPSYYIITKVDPDMRDPTEKDPANHKTFAHGQKVFRGEASGEHLIKSCYKADWRLVPKHEEEAFLSVKAEVRPKNVIKSVFPFPPLMQHLMKEQRKEQGLDDMPTLRIAIAKSVTNRAVLDTEQQQAQ